MARHIAAMIVTLFVSAGCAWGGGGKLDPVCIGQTCFAAEAQVADETLPLRGAGLLRYWGFRVYTAAFYADEEVDTPPEAIADVSRVLVLHYHRDITREQIIESTEVALARNPALDVAALRERLDQVYELYADVGPGDRFEIEYDPARGTTLLLNGTERGTIAGADFAAAFFGIWLSEYPLSVSLREKLLGAD